jgi:hypothetical protein
MPDDRKDSPRYPNKRVETFLLHPNQHRHLAFQLEQMKDNPEAKMLAGQHRFLAKHIQEKLNAGAARIKERK